MESQDGRSVVRLRWRKIALPAALTAGAIVVFGLCNAGTELTHEGGEWYTGYAGSTHTGLGKVDLYQVDARDREPPSVTHLGVELDERPVLGQEVVEDFEEDGPPVLDFLAQAPLELHSPERRDT